MPPRTRFGAGSHQQRPRRNPHVPPPLNQPIPGYAGLFYDTQNLSPAAAGRAAEGIEAGFLFWELRSLSDGRDRYMAFQLYAPVAVRIYDPVTQRLQQNKVTCNCRDYQSTQSACAHLYVSEMSSFFHRPRSNFTQWLFTRLNATLREEDQQGARTQDTAMPVEVTSGLSALYPLIEQRRDSLPRDSLPRRESLPGDLSDEPDDDEDDDELESDSDGPTSEDDM